MLRTRAFRLAIPAAAGLAILSLVTAGPAAASASKASTGRTVSATLKGAFEAARHLPGADVSGIRAGTLHVGSANGHQWAIASFSPTKSAAQKAGTSFQDGASTGVFKKTAGQWHLVQTGLYGCADGLPAALKAKWHLGTNAACTTSEATQVAAARRAFAAMPAQDRAAAKAAEARRSATATKAATAADSSTGFGQTIAAIALSQVGVDDNPVVDNFNGVDCNPYSSLVAGFSADSDGCGFNTGFGVENENETWCSDFNKYVWEQAGITADMNTINAGAVSYYDWAVQNGQNPQVDTGTFQVGDSVLFFYPGNFPVFADHVGIITSVNADGSVDMVNGDFAANPDVHVEYDTDITNMSTFAADVENPGEQWVIVAPPTSAQPPAPTGSISGPQVAVAGTTGSFHASASVAGGSVTGYYWTFGDGRTTNATGTNVTHYFSEPGTYTVSVTLTSDSGAAATVLRNIRVVAPSSPVASAPYDGIYYDPLPILQYTFTRSADGLAEDYWDGATWRQATVPGDPSATGSITALSYPDTSNADNMTPHAFYRAASGSLAETYRTTSGWVTQDLPGKPVAGGTIAATTTTSGGPAVFFIDTAGNLAESVQGSSGGWTTSELVTDAPAVSAASLTLTDTTSGSDVFAVGPDGTIRVFSSDGGSWSSRGIPAKTGAAGSLSALTTPNGHAAVVYIDAHNGSLAEATDATASTAGAWNVTDLPATPATNSSLAATTYLLPSVIPATPGDFPGQPGSTTSSTVPSPLGTEAFYLTASGSPAVAYNDGTGWKTSTLPGSATSIYAATAYQVEEEPSNVFLNGPGGITEETTGARSGDPSGDTWASLTLPTTPTPTTWPYQIVLYAADPGDAAVAQAAAAAAGLPASQVTTSYSVAWADLLSGQYLVYAVGSPAVEALYFNVCGFNNPSAFTADSTPFAYDLGPVNTLPGVDLFINSASDTAADTQALTFDNVYYALNGTLPAGVTAASMQNAAVGPSFVCAGSAS